MSGYIYCLTNASYPDLVKIGKTTREPEIRAAQLGAASGVPTEFEIAWSLQVPDIDAAESALHEALSAYRVNKRREFFKCSPAQAKARTRGLSAFRAPRRAMRRGHGNDGKLGLSLAAVTVLTILGAIQFDLDPKTIVTSTLLLCLLVTALYSVMSVFRTSR